MGDFDTAEDKKIKHIAVGVIIVMLIGIAIVVGCLLYQRYDAKDKENQLIAHQEIERQEEIRRTEEEMNKDTIVLDGVEYSKVENRFKLDTGNMGIEEIYDKYFSFVNLTKEITETEIKVVIQYDETDVPDIAQIMTDIRIKDTEPVEDDIKREESKVTRTLEFNRNLEDNMDGLELKIGDSVFLRYKTFRMSDIKNIDIGGTSDE